MHGGGDAMATGRSFALNKLTALKVQKVREPGTYEDGGGLRLVVDQRGSKRWVMRVTIAGKRREFGLGGFPSVSLEQARAKAAEIRTGARDGRDVKAETRREQQRSTVTFREAFAAYFDVKQRALSNAKHLRQWPSTMEAYVFPVIGDRPVGEITASDVLDVLAPIWFDKPETARRVLQRIEAVFQSAILRGHREKASPCVGVTAELGTKHRKVEHHRALTWAEVPEFLVALRGASCQPSTRLAFEFLILTAARSGEVRGALWSEIDLREHLWRIPAERMKARKSHDVPLSKSALAVLREARKLHSGELVFPGRQSGKALSDMALTMLLRDLGYADRATAHGFRSSFKVWCSEVAHVADEVSEAALAHIDKNRVRAAYLRTPFLEKRRPLMERWAQHVEQLVGKAR